MNVAQLNPFLTAIQDVFTQFGVTDIEKVSVQLKDDMIIDQDVTAFVGIVGEMQGNVSYCFSNETAKKIASMMMMGMPVDEMHEMARSALAELANIITGSAASIFANDEILLEITPPSLVAGEEMYFILTFLKTFTVILNSSLGTIEVNVALEL